MFLAHSNWDKKLVIILAAILRGFGLNPWLDYEQILGGSMFLEEMAKGIEASRTVIVVIGHSLGRWQRLEVIAAIQRAIEQGRLVIPVLLPGVERIPTELSFLSSFSAVRFSRTIHEPQGIGALIRAILSDRTHAKA